LLDAIEKIHKFVVTVIYYNNRNKNIKEIGEKKMAKRQVGLGSYPPRSIRISIKAVPGVTTSNGQEVRKDVDPKVQSAFSRNKGEVSAETRVRHNDDRSVDIEFTLVGEAELNHVIHLQPYYDMVRKRTILKMKRARPSIG
jgi:hypothetical protein